MNKLLIVCSSLLVLNGAILKKGKEILLSYRCDAENTYIKPVRDGFLKYVSFIAEDESTQKIPSKYVDYKNTPTEGNEIDLASIVYIEEEEPVDLGFDPKVFLPEGFNPYKQYVDLNSIAYIKDEVAISFDYDTQKYLPATFNPYTTEFSWKDIPYIKDEEEPELGFNTKDYLPTNFNPYLVSTVF